MRITSLKPIRHTYDSPDGEIRGRGGQIIIAIGETTADIKLMAEASIVKTKTVATRLLPAGVTLGDAVMCRVTGDGPDTYTVAEVRVGRCAPGAPSDQMGAVAPGGVLAWRRVLRADRRSEFLVETVT